LLDLWFGYPLGSSGSGRSCGTCRRHRPSQENIEAVQPALLGFDDLTFAGRSSASAFHGRAEQRDPVIGLNDDPEVLAYHRLMFTAPALVARLYELMFEDERALADALGNDLAAAVSAAQTVSGQRVLARRNWRALVDGARADDLYPVARAEADEAFARLALG
jgi:hypothetical protein